MFNHIFKNVYDVHNTADWICIWTIENMFFRLAKSLAGWCPGQPAISSMWKWICAQRHHSTALIIVWDKVLRLHNERQIFLLTKSFKDVYGVFSLYCRAQPKSHYMSKMEEKLRAAHVISRVQITETISH